MSRTRFPRLLLPRMLLFAMFLASSVAPAFAAERSTAVAEVAFTYGVRAYNHGDFAEAARLFREALEADPSYPDVRQWLDLAERRQREGAAAVAAPGFAGLLPLRDQPPFDLRLGATYGTDSNPAELPKDAIAVGSSIGTLKGEVKDKVTDLDLRAGVYPFYGRSGWSLGLTGQAKAARFKDLDFLNERQWSAAVQLAWGSDPLGYLTGPLGYTRVPFGASRVSFLLQAGRTDTRVNGNALETADEAALALVWRETPATATQIELDGQKRDDLDGLRKPDFWSVGASQLFFLGQRNRYLRIGALHGQETHGLDGDTASDGGTAELTLPLGDRWTLQLAGSHSRDKIERPTASFTDTTEKVAGVLTWQVAPHLFVIGRGSWAKRDSTLNLLISNPLNFRDYQRTTASLGLQWLW
jgi:tetratricopeptide (TPR) repeat protein